MKLKGRAFRAPQDDVIVFPRSTTYEDEVGPDGEKISDGNGGFKKREVNNDIPFRCRVVTEIGDFDKLFPPPQPREVVKPGGIRFKDAEAPDYKAAMTEWSERRVDWMILKSLEATPGLEWDTVDMQDPGTWHNFREELSEGLNRVELTMLINTALRVNSVDPTRMEEAKQRFLQLEAGEVNQSNSQVVELLSTLSGQPAKDSV